MSDPVATRGLLVQVNVSAGGMPKSAVLGATVRATGIDGDRQKNRKYHGGPARAVCLYSEELYAALRDEGVPVANGDVGENFTTRGIDLNRLAKGDRLRAGGCVIELTDVRVPCRQLTRWDPRLPKLIEGRSGWVARVVEEGFVKAGDAVELIGRRNSEC